MQTVFLPCVRCSFCGANSYTAKCGMCNNYRPKPWTPIETKKLLAALNS